MEQLLQISGASLIRSSGKPDENAVGRDENVAPVGEAIAQLQDLGESRRERRGQLLCFRHPAWRSGPQQQRRLAEHQRGILDKDRIRKLLQRIEHGYLDTGNSQRGDVGLVFGQNPFEDGRRARRSAQTVDDTFPGCADDGGVEIENAHGSSRTRLARSFRIATFHPAFASETRSHRKMARRSHVNPRLFAAALSLVACVCSDALAQTGNFRETAESINHTIRANHYRPAELDSEAYRQIEADVIALGEKSTSADEFMNGFNALWRKGPFSHVGLRKAEEPAADRIARFDTQIVGDGAVTLAWNGSTAILTVNTMNGADTIKAIDAAYGEIVARKARS